MLVPLLLIFFASFALILGLWPIEMSSRPKLQLRMDDPLGGLGRSREENKSKNINKIHEKIKAKFLLRECTNLHDAFGIGDVYGNFAAKFCGCGDKFPELFAKFIGEVSGVHSEEIRL